MNKSSTSYKLKLLISDLIMNAWLIQTPKSDMKPGKMILSLKSEDRELLKHSTAKDFNHRII